MVRCVFPRFGQGLSRWCRYFRWAYPANGRVYIIKFTNSIQIPKRINKVKSGRVSGASQAKESDSGVTPSSMSASKLGGLQN